MNLFLIGLLFIVLLTLVFGGKAYHRLNTYYYDYIRKNRNSGKENWN